MKPLIMMLQKKDDVKALKDIIKSLEEKINKFINSGDKEKDFQL